VSVYKRALTSNEIAAIYNAGSEGKCPVPPVIVTQPINQAVGVGGTATFSVSANGTQPLTYQWIFNGTNILGATNTLLTLTNVQFTQAGNYSVVVANIYGSALSSNAVLTVGVLPSITMQPANSTNLVGSSATFTVTAAGSTPLSYQWLKNGTAIAGATSTNFIIINVQTNDAGVYAVLVTNVFGSITSFNAILTVFAPPMILVQPTNQTVTLNNSTTFIVVAGGSTPLSYQWSFNGTNIFGATNNLLPLLGVQFSQAGVYAVAVTNAYGSVISSNAILTVNPPPPCDSAPSGMINWWKGEGNANDNIGTNNGVAVGTLLYTNGEVGEGFLLNGSNYVSIPSSPTFNVLTNAITIEMWIKVNAIDPGDLGWTAILTKGDSSWRLARWNTTTFQLGFSTSGLSQGDLEGNRNIMDGQWHHVAAVYDGSTKYIYVDGTLDVSAPATGSIATNSFPVCIGENAEILAKGLADRHFNGIIDEVSVYKRALTSNEIAAIYNAGSAGKCPVPPVIVTQPTNKTVLVGATATFSVSASGTQPLAYQWNFNGTNILGATNILLVLTNVQPVQAGTYIVQVSNVAGLTNSFNAILTVNTSPSITTQPTNMVVIRGSNATFNVIAAGSTPLIYQWNFNGTNVAAATNSSLTLTNVQLNQAGNYAVSVTNLFGSILSSNATLTVNPLFHFVWNHIPSPRFANAPFAVVVQAQNTTNGLATNFTDTVVLLSTNGVPVNPAVSANFIQGVWTGAVMVAQTGTNLVLQATDSFGESGLANAINVVNLPPLAAVPSGGTLFVSWPTSPSGFILETTPTLSPASWAQVSGSPFQIGNQFVQSITLSGTNGFYRLRFTGQ